MSATIVWFRDDLRLGDNPALAAAMASGRPIVCLYLLDDTSPGHRLPGAAARWWLHHSLAALGEALARLGGRLTLRRGAAAAVLPAFAVEADAQEVHWNRRYAPAETRTDEAVARRLGGCGIAVSTHAAGLLYEPGDVATKGGAPFRVFTPFWRAAARNGDPRRPLPRPRRLEAASRLASDRLEDWALSPSGPDWSAGLGATWTPGEAGARAALAEFLDTSGRGYAERRDRPDVGGTSHLSPHLRSGEVSPHQIWHGVRHAEAAGTIGARDADKFLAELGWREFSYHLLRHRRA